MVSVARMPEPCASDSIAISLPGVWTIGPLGFQTYKSRSESDNIIGPAGCPSSTSRLPWPSQARCQASLNSNFIQIHPLKPVSGPSFPLRWLGRNKKQHQASCDGRMSEPALPDTGARVRLKQEASDHDESPIINECWVLSGHDVDVVYRPEHCGQSGDISDGDDSSDGEAMCGVPGVPRSSCVAPHHIITRHHHGNCPASHHSRSFHSHH